MSVSVEEIIRPMTEKDLEAVLALEACGHVSPWSEAMFREELANPVARIDLLWRGSDLAGFLCAWRVSDELSILSVVTAPLMRRTGVARRLLMQALERNGRSGMVRALLEVRSSNCGAIALYASLGFRQVSRRRGYYQDGEDALVMELRYQHCASSGC